jgi:holo-[acyl-carrier protein] synthase
VIISIGTDIIEVERIRQTLERTPRFVERVFTAAERDYCSGRPATAVQHYAARFAAKEAALKAFKTGWSGGISWHDVEVSRDSAGAPFLKLAGKTLELYQELGATAIHLSMSHTTEHAIAFVVIERID